MPIKSIVALTLFGLTAGLARAAEPASPVTMPSVMQNMTPEQQQAMRTFAQAMRQRMEQMTPEQRQAMRSRMQEQMQRMNSQNNNRPYGTAP